MPPRPSRCGYWFSSYRLGAFNAPPPPASGGWRNTPAATGLRHVDKLPHPHPIYKTCKSVAEERRPESYPPNSAGTTLTARNKFGRPHWQPAAPELLRGGRHNKHIRHRPAAPLKAGRQQTAPAAGRRVADTRVKSGEPTGGDRGGWRRKRATVGANK